ncbi:Ap-1 complex subunit mu-2 [Thalictrum thalictroides]|uniref:carbonic anhydrase n=1 Tax=Thalictrum thalictroides TaxID=46969 RepID=A0A7J6X1S6_THATH|nr:Ap-1 complex subunit mu-2 [Thalictrum thalictroides]
MSATTTQFPLFFSSSLVCTNKDALFCTPSSLGTSPIANRIYCSQLKLAKINETHLRSIGSVKRNLAFRSEASKETQSLTQELKEMSAVREDSETLFDELRNKFLSFKKLKYLENLDHFQNLAQGQSPKFMVIACADSRVCPSNILGFQPGDAFIVRNVANLVPPFETGPSETNAGLEFAVNSLEVENILVIGHSCCGGIRALMSMQDEEHSSSFIKPWVLIGKRASLSSKAAAANLSFEQQCRHCEKESVNHSLVNLLTYPWVEERKLESKKKNTDDDLAVLRSLSKRRQYHRSDVPKGSAEIFFRKVKFWKEDEEEEAPPVFNLDGVNYFHVKVAGLLFVATTRVNMSPSLVLELLHRIARVIKDYLGVLNEDSFRKNFVLVYELLDEVIDFGYAQTTSTELLKSYVFNEPIVVDSAHLPPLGPAAMFMQGTKRMPGTAVTKSVVANEPGGRKREEIFVDIIEKISVTFSSSGYILTSEIDGTIQMKSYLTGNPEIRLALNEDLNIGRGGRSVYDYGSSSGAGSVVLDDCNFHESVHLDSFDVDRTLSLVPPDGEFPVMNYRMTQEFKPPFRINALIEEAGAFKAEVILKVRAEFPSTITANTIVVQMALPKHTTRVSFELESGAVGHTTDFKEANKKLEWGLKKIVGGSEHTLRAKLTFSQESHGNIMKEAGPVSMTFTIPMYNASKLQVRYLQIAKKSKTYNPYRWVRYVTQANSYVARL